VYAPKGVERPTFAVFFSSESFVKQTVLSFALSVSYTTQSGSDGFAIKLASLFLLY